MLSYDQLHRIKKRKKAKGSRTVWKYAQADFEQANELLSDIAVDDMEKHQFGMVQMDYQIHGCS